MRYLGVGLACLVLAGCKAADGPGETTSAAQGVAFAYRYEFSLPSARIADAQEADAQACEQLGPSRCRITGMSYRLDGSGEVAASLDVRVAAPNARAFGRRGIKAMEAAGGALVGAEITGTDAGEASAQASASVADAGTELADVDRQLARVDLAPQARGDLTARRDELLRAQREASTAAQAARESVVTTPIRLTYTAGSGVGLAARLSEAGHVGYLSLTWTLVTALTALAMLGPPLVLLLLTIFVWRRWARGWWARAFPPRPAVAVADRMPGGRDDRDDLAH